MYNDVVVQEFGDHGHPPPKYMKIGGKYIKV